MTTRLEATVDIDLSSAQSQLNRLQADLDQISGTITIPVTVTGEQQVTELRQEIDRASGVIDVDVDSSELTRGERALESINNELREAQGELRQAQTRADALGDELKRTGTVGVGAFTSIRQSLGPLVAAVAGGAAIGAIVQQLNEAVTAASNLEQSIGGVEAIFGRAADEVLAFGQNAAQVVGLSTSAANALAVQLGGQLQSYGFAADEAATQTARLITLGADLAATVGGPVAQAVEAVGSLLRGETNPIEQYGVSMNVAAIEAHALEQGIIGAGEQLTIQTKALAALDLLFRQTTGAQGQFARESETTAGQLERMRAEFANVQAEVGEALVPAFKAGVSVIRDLLPLLVDLGPAFGTVGNLAGQTVGNVAPFITLLGEAAATAALLGSAIDNLPTEIPLFSPGGGAAALGTISQAFFDIRDSITIGATQGQLDEFLKSVTEAASDAENPVNVLAAAFGSLNDQGVDASRVVRQLADASAVSDAQLAAFLRTTIAEADALGLTADQALLLQEILLAMPEALVFGGRGGIDSNTVTDLEAMAAGLGIAKVALDDFRLSSDLAFDQTQADNALSERFGDLPTIVTNFEELDGALRRGGISLGEFLDSGADASGIIGTFDAVETGVLNVLAALEELPGELAATREAFLGVFDVDVDSETGKISADTSAFKDDVIADFQAITDFEIDLSEIAISGEAPDVAAFLRGEGLAAADLAEALLGNPEDLAAAQDALAGSAEALATGTAEAYAGFLKTLTPQEVAALGVFAAENFVSPAVTSQIGESAIQIGEDMKTALATLSIPFGGVIDFSGAQLTGLVNTGAVPIGGGFGDTPGQTSSGGTGREAPPGANYQININNPTTQDVGTSATQAAQTIAATGSLLAAVR